MKRRYLIAIAISPAIVGYFYNNMILIPGLGVFLLKLFPIIMFIYWFIVGKRLAFLSKNMYKDIMLSHSVGLISLVIYLWQFLLVDDEHRNRLLAGFSQMFSSSISPYMAKIVILFSGNNIGQGTLTAMQILGLLCMFLVFSIGYMFGKKE